MMMPEIISAISGGKYWEFIKLPPVVICEMNSAEKIAPIGLDEASRATAIPLKPMAGRAVESNGLHSAMPER